MEITFSDATGSDIYGGSLGIKTLKTFFTEDFVNLGVIPSGSSKDFRVKIKFPTAAGNEYQEGKVVFTLSFGAILIPIELPAECSDLQGVISEVINGTDLPDVLFGSDKSELILGKNGADLISSGGGADCVVGGDGSDVIFTDGGSIVIGGSGNDRVSGGSGENKLYGGDGDDVIFGGGGNDVVDGGPGSDQVDGGAGTDTCTNGEIQFNCEI